MKGSAVAGLLALLLLQLGEIGAFVAPSPSPAASPHLATMMSGERHAVSSTSSSSEDRTGSSSLTSTSSTSTPSTILTIGAVQPALRSPGTSPLESAERAAALIRGAFHADDDDDGNDRRRRGDVDLFVLPELCPVGYSEDTFANHMPSSGQEEGREEADHFARKIDEMFSALAKVRCLWRLLMIPYVWDSS